jgi:flagellar biosynthesis protein FlhG
MLDIKQQMTQLHAITAHDFRQAEVVSVSSGKGGVGKTLSALYFAIFARKFGFKVLVVDGTFGMSNISSMCGFNDKYSIKNIFDHPTSFDSQGFSEIVLMSSGSDLVGLQELSLLQKKIFTENLNRWKDVFDLIVLDSSPGIGKNVIFLNQLAQHNIVVTTPEPHAVSDAYVLIKNVHKELRVKKMSLLLNMTKSSKEAVKTASEISNVCRDQYGVKIHFMGEVPFDPTLSNHILHRTVGGEENSKSIAAHSFGKIMRKFFDEASFIKSTKKWSLVDAF